jgi:CubicO group peptidase (beta-lactamase class C family)
MRAGPVRALLFALAALFFVTPSRAAPVGRDTRFQLASVTKMFTGVLLMRLVEQGKVGLDDPLKRWLPVLRAILEKAGGKPLPQLLREELLLPLGMTSTGFAMATDDGSG